MSVLAKLPYANQIRTSIFFSKAFNIKSSESRRLLVDYLTGKLFPKYEDKVHLDAAMKWLAGAQDICLGKGVSNVYFLNSGWGEAYPETSGYILATYITYSDYTGDVSYLDRAIKIGDWEIDIQAPNGGIFSSEILRQTRVFNTGQVLLGWSFLFERTNNQKYLDAAIRAGDYLVGKQEADGSWHQDTYCGARTYHARVAWGLLRLGQLTGEAKYIQAAKKNLQWVLNQQAGNGWFYQCGFNDDLPIMHVIVYTLRGLLESALINIPEINNLDILPKVIKTADTLCQAIQKYPVKNINGMMPTAFDSNWVGQDKDSCLTGNAQMACFLYKLFHTTGNEYYRQSADTILDATKRTQLVETSLLPLKGAIPGTYPLSHGYIANGFPNWATKFFADALLMRLNLEQKLSIPA